MIFSPSRSFRSRRAICSLALAFGCGWSTSAAFGQAPPAQAPNGAAIERAANVLYLRTLEKARARNALDVDRGRLAEIRRAAAALTEPARALRLEAATWSWAIHLETREEPIAYCLPGGQILVSTGLVDRFSLSMPELAAVLAHVVAHALAAEHAAATIAESSRGAEGVGADPNRAALVQAEILARTVGTLRHDAASELAADALGLELMARGGLDPRPAVDAWRKIARGSDESPPAFPALHPSSPERFAALETHMPAMVALYEKTLAERPAEAPAKKRRPSRPR